VDSPDGLDQDFCTAASGREGCRDDWAVATPSFFFFTLVAGPRRSLSLKLNDKRVYEPQIRARLGTTARFCEVVATPPPKSLPSEEGTT